MKLVSPESIKTSRVYFTEFDRITYSQVAWSSDDVECIRRNMERKLKLLALIKGHVVIAASHLLESELAQEVLFRHPRLFAEEVVVPALRSEFTGFEQFLDAKISEGKEADQYKGLSRREMAQMLDSQVALAVQWDVHQTSGWFKQRMLSDLQDEHSLLCSCLRTANVLVPRSLSSQIREAPSLSRQDVYLLAKSTQNKTLWDLLCNYADFVYYLSGARAVRSEGILPQENLMDFSLSDMANGRTHLSETEVFFKIFIDLVKPKFRQGFGRKLLITHHLVADCLVFCVHVNRPVGPMLSMLYKILDPSEKEFQKESKSNRFNHINLFSLRNLGLKPRLKHIFPWMSWTHSP